MSLWSVLGGVGGFILGGRSGAAIGASIGAGLDSSSASKQAADTQAAAANQANNTQLQMYNQTRTDNMPWHDAGAAALNQLATGTAPGGEFTHTFNTNDFKQDPGYQFRLQQGQEALDNSASARGSLLSGAQLRATADYNQNFASNEYSNAYNRFNNDESLKFNRLSGIAGTGQAANALLGQVGASTADNISNNQIGAGNARASGYMGSANAISGAIGQGLNWYNQNQAIQQLGRTNALNNPGGGTQGATGSLADLFGSKFMNY